MIRSSIAGLMLALLVSGSITAGIAAQEATPEASPVAVAEELTVPVNLVPWVVTDQMSP